jgi:hypothetical protein
MQEKEIKQLSLFDGVTLDPEVTIPESARKIAEQREWLVKQWLDCEDLGIRFDGKSYMKHFVENYNTGIFVDAFSVLGKISLATFYNWRRDYREGGVDALVPRYATGIPGVSLAEKRCMGEIIREGISIGRAIFICKYFLKRRGTPSPSSPATLRRWATKIKTSVASRKGQGESAQ